jgi:hypothetical protein
MTSITSPFGPVDSDDKTRVQCKLPTVLYQELFLQMFPMRGAQDRITAHLLDWFYKQMLVNKVPVSFQLHNEEVAQEFLNQLPTLTISIPHVERPL